MKRSLKIEKDAVSIKKGSLLIRGMSIALTSVMVLVTTVYVISYFYNRFSSFTVSVQQYDRLRQGLTLSETDDFINPISRLNAGSIKECTNISGDTLPLNINMIDGEHSGDNYIAYTFYIMNMGNDTVSYRYSLNIANVTNGIDEAIRVRVYQNGEYNDYAKTRSDGTGAELGTIEFSEIDIALTNARMKFRSGDVDKYTVVVWLEGNDPDCIDGIIGGRLKLEMNFEITEI